MYSDDADDGIYTENVYCLYIWSSKLLWTWYFTSSPLARIYIILKHLTSSGRRGQMSIVFACGDGSLKHPGFDSRAHLLKDRDLYTRIVRVACNGQQYGVVNTYMLATCL